MYVMLILVLLPAPQTTAIRFESLSECEAGKPRIVQLLKEAEAVAYAISCVSVVKMEGV